MTANPADLVTDSNARGPGRFDRTLRTVMWLDAFLSVALVVVCVIASPILATVDVPEAALSVIGSALIVCAVLLAAFGAITAVALMLRMHAGQYLLPVNLRLPLPAPMRPAPLNPYDSPVEKKSKKHRADAIGCEPLAWADQRLETNPDSPRPTLSAPGALPLGRM